MTLCGTYALSTTHTKLQNLADLYDVTADKLGKLDPRRFYLMVLQGLRIAQLRTTRTPLINVGVGCDPEAGLYFQEEFYQQQLAKTGADQHTVDLVFDIERLRTLYQLTWNLFNKGIDDVRGTTWRGDNAVAPDNVTPMVAASCAHFVSAGCRLDFRGRFGTFVSALQNRVSPRQRPVLVETRFEY